MIRRILSAASPRNGSLCGASITTTIARAGCWTSIGSTSGRRLSKTFARSKRLVPTACASTCNLASSWTRRHRRTPTALEQLAKLVQLAEDNGLYLDVTGLACYHKQHIPAWYDKLNEQDRWKVQAVFWEAIARTCADSPAIFCYDLMNEPILPAEEPASDWLAGELAGKYFVQRITLDLKDRTREQVAKAWIDTLVDAIRKHDQRHMVTVGEFRGSSSSVAASRSSMRRKSPSAWTSSPFTSIQRRKNSTKRSWP